MTAVHHHTQPQITFEDRPETRPAGQEEEVRGLVVAPPNNNFNDFL